MRFLLPLAGLVLVSVDQAGQDSAEFADVAAGQWPGEVAADVASVGGRDLFESLLPVWGEVHVSPAAPVRFARLRRL